MAGIELVPAELSPLERMEVQDQLAATQRKLRRDPWVMLASLLVAAAVQYPIFGLGIGLAISVAILIVLFGWVELRDRRRTKALVAELEGLLGPTNTP